MAEVSFATVGKTTVSLFALFGDFNSDSNPLDLLLSVQD